MEMEVVKPFGEALTTENTELVCLSRQKIKLHFFRWSVAKEQILKLEQQLQRPFQYGEQMDDIPKPPEATKDGVERQERKIIPPPKGSDIFAYALKGADLEAEFDGSATLPSIEDLLNQDSHQIPRNPVKAELREQTIDGIAIPKFKTLDLSLPPPKNVKKNSLEKSSSGTKPPSLALFSEKVFTGYLYILHPQADEKEAYEEFYVDEVRQLTPVDWSYIGKQKEQDVRPVIADKGCLDWYEYNPPTSATSDEIWAAFSTVQWSYDYLTKIYNDPDLRAERMQKIICKPWKQGQENPNDVETIHYFCQRSSSNLAVDFFANFTTPAPSHTLERPLGNLSSMHVLLDDPIYIADRVSEILEEELGSLARLVKSIQTGIPPEEINLADTTVSGDEEINYLHLLALTTYQLLYSTEENFDTYAADLAEERLAQRKIVDFLFSPVDTRVESFRKLGTTGVDIELLEKVLAIKERFSRKQAIDLYRQDLGTLLLSDRYQNRLLDYLENIETRRQDGKCLTLRHVAILTKMAGQIDNHLRLEADQESSYRDEWVKELSKLEIGGSSMRNTLKLIDAELICDDFYDYSLLEFKACPAFKVMTEGHIQDEATSVDIVSVSLIQRMFGFAAYLNEARLVWAPLVKHEAQRFLFKKKYVHIYFDTPIDKKSSYAVIKYRNNEILDLLDKHTKVKVKSKKGQSKVKMPIKKFNIKKKKLDLQYCSLVIGKKSSDFEKIFSRVVSSPEFVSVETVLQGLNFLQTCRESNFKDGLERASVVVEAAATVTQAIQLVDKVAPSSVLAKSLLRRGVFSFATRFAPVLDAVSSVLEMAKSENNKDYDAALAHGAAAVCALATGACIFIGVVGWPLLVLACIGFGLLAAYLTDTALEHYLKHFPLATHQSEISGYIKKQPYHTLQNLRTNMPVLCARGDLAPEEDRTFEKHYVMLMDFLCPIKITLQTAISNSKTVAVQKHKIGTGGTIFFNESSTRIGRVDCILINLEFFGGTVPDSLDECLEIFVFTLDKSLYEIDTSLKVIYNRSPTGFSVDISVPHPRDHSAFLRENNPALLLCRLNSGQGYMPLPFNGKARYFVFPFRMFQLGGMDDPSGRNRWLSTPGGRITLNDEQNGRIDVISMEELKENPKSIVVRDEPIPAHYRSAVTSFIILNEDN